MDHFSAAASPRANLSVAIKATGEAYNTIGWYFEKQPQLDWEPFGDILHLYRGIIASFPDILTVHKVLSFALQLLSDISM